MEENTYSDRLAIFLFRGVGTGAIYGLLSPILYLALMYIVMFVLPVLGPSNPSNDESFRVSNFYLAVIFWGIPSVIPSILIGIVDGALVAAILATWRYKPGNLQAAFVGLVAGTILVIIINYLVWHNLHISRQAYYPFWHFIIPIGMDVAHFTTTRNLYFLHSLIAICLSTFGTLQVNKRVPERQKTG